MGILQCGAGGCPGDRLGPSAMATGDRCRPGHASCGLGSSSMRVDYCRIEAAKSWPWRGHWWSTNSIAQEPCSFRLVLAAQASMLATARRTLSSSSHGGAVRPVTSLGASLLAWAVGFGGAGDARMGLLTSILSTPARPDSSRGLWPRRDDTRSNANCSTLGSRQCKRKGTEAGENSLGSLVSTAWNERIVLQWPAAKASSRVKIRRRIAANAPWPFIPAMP